MTAICADLELARRLEGAESYAAETFARGLVQHKPGADVVVEDIAGGRAVYSGPGSPLTEVKAVGLHGPVSDTDLDRMGAVYFSRNEPCRVALCPLADATFVEGLGRRGYRLTAFENLLALPLSGEAVPPPPPPGITIHRAETGDAETYAKVVAPNFAGPGEELDAILEMMHILFGLEHSVAFLARVDGTPAGGGAVLVHRGLALLAGAATLPAYRNRGVHAALHHARLAFARAVGCDLAVQGAQPGSTSERNAHRRGLRLAYTRAMLVRDPSH